MNVLKFRWLCYLLTMAFVSHGQVVDTNNYLSEVEVSASRLSEFSSGNKNESLDSTLIKRYLTTNLADLLANESQIFIKSYGIGSLATTSFRGAGAGHTAVLWNGFNMQSSMNGLIDMSLIPVFFLSNAQLQYGGAGALWGSGSVGGTIHLNNTSSFNRGLSIIATTAVGSFMDKQKQLSIAISKKTFSSSIKMFYHDAKNDFPFKNTTKKGSPITTTTNASLKQYGLLQENYFKINSRQKINSRIWLQHNDRNFPPSMSENKSAANQKDASLRMSSEWERKTGKLQTLLRAAWFREQLIYSDSLVHLYSKSLSKTFISEAEARFRISKFDLLNIGVFNSYSIAENKNYRKSPEQNKFAVFASYKIHTKHQVLNSVISVRQEFIKGKVIPFTPSFGLEFKPFSFFRMKANAAQHYRIPTFNDLYWSPGGNPNLKPESGWSEELSLIHHHSYKTLDWELAATGFNRNIDNWIIWLPNQLNIWSPENVLKVWSRGLEYKLNLSHTARNFHFQLKGLYNYILSTNQQTDESNKNSLNKQLIYVPVQNAQGSFSIGYKATSIYFTQVYTGYRYTLSDNSKYLSPYSISNISVEQLFVLKELKVKAYLKLNNVFGEVYQVMAYRAMPLLNYQLGCTFYFNQPMH